MGTGYLRVSLTAARAALPFAGERIYIKTDGFTETLDATYNVDTNRYSGTLLTDASGITDAMPVRTPDASVSLDENSTAAPYAAADVYVNVAGYYPVRVLGAQVFDGETSVLPIDLTPLSASYTEASNGVIVIRIPPALLRVKVRREPLFYDPAVASPQVLTRVVVPAQIAVHLGAPSSPAQNIYVPFTDYIKNVASSEIYPTWHENALRANILAILSITLNRVFSEWYPSQGYDFDITSSTAFDQAFVPGRNYFDSISRIVDEIFNQFIVRGGYISPVFASYCDGVRTQCAGLSQWGSESLAADGYSVIDILRYYYGREIGISSTENIGGTAVSYPGAPLVIGSRSNDVQLVRRYLYRVSDNYPNIPRVNPAYLLYDTALSESVRVFQRTFGLEPSGAVDLATWYKLSFIYTSVTELAETGGAGDTGPLGLIPPDTTTAFGDVGIDTARLQYQLNYIGLFYTNIAPLTLDGYFGNQTEQAVREFQRTFGLAETGRVTPQDWQKVFEVYYGILETVTPALGEQSYPGTPLENGSRSEAVRLMQTYLSRIADAYPTVPKIAADGIFGARTEDAVRAFQTRFMLPVTGVIDGFTWGRIAEIYNYLKKSEA